MCRVAVVAITFLIFFSRKQLVFLNKQDKDTNLWKPNEVFLSSQHTQLLWPWLIQQMKSYPDRQCLPLHAQKNTDTGCSNAVFSTHYGVFSASVIVCFSCFWKWNKNHQIHDETKRKKWKEKLNIQLEILCWLPAVLILTFFKDSEEQ